MCWKSFVSDIYTIEYLEIAYYYYYYYYIYNAQLKHKFASKALKFLCKILNKVANGIGDFSKVCKILKEGGKGKLGGKEFHRRGVW